MITIEIPETKRKVYMPENLAECDSQQYAEACYLIYRYQQGYINYHDFRVQMVYRLLNLKKGNTTLSQDENAEKYSNIFLLSEYIDSFFERDESDKLVIAQYYVNNHSQVVRDSFKTWYGPKDHFEDITFGQYIDGLNLYHSMEQSIDRTLLNRLMATFYFEKKQGYNPTKVEERSKHFQYVYFGRVYGFFLLFASFQKYLFSATVTYSGKELDLSILFDSGESKNIESSIPGIGMLSVAHQLAESNIYGNLDKVRKRNFWEVILGLYDLRKRDLDEIARRNKEEANAKNKNK